MLHVDFYSFCRYNIRSVVIVAQQKKRRKEEEKGMKNQSSDRQNRQTQTDTAIRTARLAIRLAIITIPPPTSP